VGTMPRLRVAVAIVVVAAFSTPSALACGRGYSYAGLYSTRAASGVAATLSMIQAPSIPAGHVAAWVGVGGPGLGPNGSDEWLQVGLASFPGSADGHLYYELALPGKKPEYRELAAGVAAGDRLRVAVLELPFARGSWVVVSRTGIVGPFYLPRSHGAWAPITTAESWDAGGSRCNRYAYRFGGIQLARRDGSWRKLRRARELRDPGRQLHRITDSTFSATAA
jgi:hypothetical protein